MAINVRIPQPLRGLTADKSIVPGSGASLAACIADLESAYPGMRERLMDDGGQLRDSRRLEQGRQGQTLP